ncbi:MAG: GDSL-type esterase/lipase family protein [Ferruginibacter sp.]
MPNLFTRFTLIVSIMLLFAGKASANDSDIVNCNHAWTIVVLGSSSAYGYGATTYDSSWVGKFTAYVKRKNSSNIVYNLGIPGFTTYQNLCPTGFVPPANRPSPDNSFNITQALALHPDAIIINMPTNDAANDYTVAEQQANYERTMHLADSANIPVWVTTTQPRNNMSAAEINLLTTMRDWTYTRFGDKAVDFWTNVANSDGSINSFYAYDYAHVNNHGHDLFYHRMAAETILDSLCNRVVQTLVVRAGNDVSITIPTTTVTLNGSGTFSSLGGIVTSYLWQLVSSPAGSSPVIASPNNVTTAINNLTEGRYSFSLTSTDNGSNTGADTVNVIVSSRILIDFGPDATASPDGNGYYWNNISIAQPGVRLSNAVTTTNAATTIGLTVVNRIDGTFNVAGPGTNTGNTTGAVGDYPATATTDFAFAEPSATNGQWKITGLDPTKQYTVKFWGSRTVADDRIIQIKRADQTTWQEYNATNNTIYSNAAVFTFFSKTEMTFDIRVKAGSAFGYIGVIDITRTSRALANNLLPIPRANDVNVSLPGTTGTLDGSPSSDDDGSITAYQWTQVSGPTTAGIQFPNNAITPISNLVEGVYVFHLDVTDDSSAVAGIDVNVVVNTRVLFDFGPTSTVGADAGGKYWNNVADGLPGTKVTNAITTGNTASTISLSIINRIDGTFNLAGPGTSTGNTIGDVGDYPSTATTDYAFAHPSTTNGKWKITGLDSTKQYTVKFWGTRSGVSDDRIIRIRRDDDPSSTLQYDGKNNTNYNNGATFTFTEKTEMTFDITVDPADAFGYISVVDIKITKPPVICVPVITIASSQSVASCSGSPVTFTANTIRGGTAPTYQWKKNGMNINGATSSIYTTTTLLNNDAISCVVTANTVCADGVTATSNIINASVLPIVPKAGPISGPTSVCDLVGTANNAVYSIAPLANATIYVWTVPAGATIVSGQGTTSIAVSFNSSLGNVDTIKVLGGFCTNSSPTTLVISKTIPAIPGAITGPTDVCPFIDQPTNATYSIAAVANATSYTWTMPIGANIVSGQGTTSVQVSYTNSFISGSIKVTADANCGSRAPRSLTVSKVVPAAPSTISGVVNACQYLGTNTQVIYSIAPVANATSYLWTLPANVNLVSGQGTTSITVTFGAGFTTSSIKVKSISNCSASADKSLSVATTTSSTPGAITGPTNACLFIGTTNLATYTIRQVSNASSYIWNVPAGATITSHPGGAGVNDTIITVSFDNSFVSATNISVQSAGCVPSAARTLSVLKNGAPATPGSITGLTNPCGIVGTATTATYTIPKVANATSYNWVLPSGANATHPAGSGANDTVISVTYIASFATGTISVSATNGCGTGAARALVIKTLVPVTKPTITGPTDPCPWIGTPGATYTIKPIANATSYTWTIPATGATATHPNGAGINDTIIIVTYTSAFTTGSITARADANCGSTATGSLTLTRKLPSVPGGISTTVLATCPNRQYGYSVAALPTNATSILWAVPAGATIVSGQGSTSIVVNYPQTATAGAVTAIGVNNCANGTSTRTLNINLPACAGAKQGNIVGKGNNTPAVKTEEEPLAKDLEIKVMPNPTYNDFKLVITSNDKNTPIYLRLTDISSKIIEIKPVVIPGQVISIGANYTKGIYIGEIIQGDKHRVVKLVKL